MRVLDTEELPVKNQILGIIVSFALREYFTEEYQINCL